MTDLVSVIIPAYNAATRIRITLESVIAQDYDDTEIIVVDDASNDTTGEISRAILKTSGRQYRVITHKVNKGVSAARNAGFDASRGEYACFVDGDDILRENFVSSLHDAIDDCDISFCGLTDTFTDGRKDAEMRFTRGLQRGGPGENVILNDTVPPFMCCMYRADFLRRCGIAFLEGCSSGEDVDFITRALCAAGSVGFTDSCPYLYVHHGEMGSVRDNDTRDKRILRYEHNTTAQSHTAQYLRQHAESPLLRDIAGKIMMPQNVIRRLNLAAMKNDRAEYDAIIHDDEAMRVLRDGLGVFALRRKPEVFVKALMIKYLPGLYYRMRTEI